MKLAFAVAAVTGLLCLSGAAAPSSAIAREGQAHAAPSRFSLAENSDLSARRRFHRRHVYNARYARPLYQPYYYGRPVEYRPYGLVPFFFGLSFPYRTW